MADSAESNNVFLDTEVFDRHSRDFNSANLRRLLRLSAAGTVRLLMTTVTEREVREHLDRDAKAAFKQLHNYKRVSRLVKRLLPEAKFEPGDEEVLRLDVHHEFDAFIRDAKIEVLSVQSVDPESVFEKYFDRKPPFGEGEKKSEFPDAFAFARVQQWSEENGAKVWVISGDVDWKKACRATSSLIHLNSVEKLLEQFQDAVIVTGIKQFLEEKTDALKQLIKSEAEILDYYLGDELIDAEFDDLEVEDVDIEEFHIVEAKDGHAVVTAFCKIAISATVTALDPDSMWKDPDDGEFHSVWNLRGVVTNEIEREVTVRVRYAEGDPENGTIDGVTIEQNSVELAVEESDLSTDADDDYEEPDIDYEEPDPRFPEEF